MPNSKSNAKFANSPLITPERLISDWSIILEQENLPEWIRILVPMHTGPEDEDAEDPFPENVEIVVGKKSPNPYGTTTVELALYLELTRFGHSLVTNANGDKPTSRNYLKLSFRGGKSDLMSVRRISYGAKAGEATRPVGRENDYGSDNTYAEGDGHPDKDARMVTLGHVMRVAKEAEARGELTVGLTVDAYINNIGRLFEILGTLFGPDRNEDLEGSFARYMAALNQWQL